MVYKILGIYKKLTANFPNLIYFFRKTFPLIRRIFIRSPSHATTESAFPGMQKQTYLSFKFHPHPEKPSLFSIASAV